ncbi:MAG: hypothetical protein E7280_00010 [Lachnospiraceae bacterium]|nr:hypothetical protein [Lachnospiraceae bacterium]
MKQIKRIALILLLVIVFTACGKEEHEQAQTVEVKWANHREEINGRNQPCYFTELDGVRYVVQSGAFDESKATKRVNDLNQVIRYGSKIFSDKKENAVVYLGFSTGEQQIPLDSELTAEGIFNVMESVYPVNCGEQYGLFYLYAVNRDLIKKDEADQNELKRSFDDCENLYLLDFCSPMVESVYMTEKEAELCRYAVKSFASWYVEKYSFKDYETLCRDIKEYDKTKLVALKNDWLKSIGCKNKYEEFCKAFFVPNTYRAHDTKIGMMESYELPENDAIWVWDDRDVKQLGYKEMMEQYKEIEPLRRKDFANVREFLENWLPPKIGKPYMITQFVQGENGDNSDEAVSGRQSPINNCIYLYHDWEQVKYSLLHEYVHYLTIGEGKILPVDNRYFPEFFAVWIAEIERTGEMQDNYFKKRCEDETVRQSYQEAGFWNEKKQQPITKYNMLEVVEYCFSNGLVKKFFSLEKFRNDAFGYSMRGCMAKYVYDTYGMDKLVEWAQSDGEPDEILGITFKQLQEDTWEWIQNELERVRRKTR